MPLPELFSKVDLSGLPSQTKSNKMGWFAPLIGAGVGILSDVIARNQQRKAEIEAYNRQRRDNLEFWNLQNEYNHPANQAKRIQDAGLNKALMYGQSASGGNASPISPTDAQPYTTRYPEGSVPFALGILSQYADVRIKQAEARKTEAQANIEETVQGQRMSIINSKAVQEEFKAELAEAMRSAGVDAQARAKIDQMINQAAISAIKAGKGDMELKYLTNQAALAGHRARYEKEVADLLQMTKGLNQQTIVSMIRLLLFNR